MLLGMGKWTRSQCGSCWPCSGVSRGQLSPSNHRALGTVLEAPCISSFACRNLPEPLLCGSGRAVSGEGWTRKDGEAFTGLSGILIQIMIPLSEDSCHKSISLSGNNSQLFFWIKLLLLTSEDFRLSLLSLQWNGFYRTKFISIVKKKEKTNKQKEN